MKFSIFAMALSLLLFINTVIIRGYKSRQATFELIHEDKVLETSEYERHAVKRPLDCTHRCLANEACKSFILWLENNPMICDVLFVDSSDSVTFKIQRGASYYEIVPKHTCEIGLTDTEIIATADVYIPFKKYNPTCGCTPYGRGTDQAGKTNVTLLGFESYIAHDQFGKGNVLHTGNNQPIILGDFRETSIGNPKHYGKRFTISVWIRITDAFLDIHHAIIANTKPGGISMFLGKTSDSLIYPGTFMNTDSHQIWLERKVKVDAWKYFYWTHLAVRWLGDQDSFHIFENGSVVEISRFDWENSHSGTYVARNNCGNCYISELAVWFSNLSNHDIKSIYESGRAKIDQSRTRITAKSCKALLQEGVYTTSGYYWINLAGDLKTVYCDMITDGGGWTEVTRIYAKDVESLETVISNDIDGITKTYLHRFALSSLGFRKLKNVTEYDQMRIYCSSPIEHSRTVDMATIGTKVVDYLTEVESDKMLVPCRSFYPIGNDTSYLKFGCQQLGDGIQNARLYTSLVQEMNQTRLHVGHNGVYNCDSWTNGEESIFKVFIR